MNVSINYTSKVEKGKDLKAKHKTTLKKIIDMCTKVSAPGKIQRRAGSEGFFSFFYRGLYMFLCPFFNSNRETSFHLSREI